MKPQTRRGSACPPACLLATLGLCSSPTRVPVSNPSPTDGGKAADCPQKQPRGQRCGIPCPLPTHPGCRKSLPAHLRSLAALPAAGFWVTAQAAALTILRLLSESPLPVPPPTPCAFSWHLLMEAEGRDRPGWRGYVWPEVSHQHSRLSKAVFLRAARSLKCSFLS